MMSDNFDRLIPGMAMAERFAGLILLGCPLVSAGVAFALARRGSSAAASASGGFFAGMLVLIIAFMTKLADLLGPMVLAMIPYMLVVAGGGFVGATFGAKYRPAD